MSDTTETVSLRDALTDEIKYARETTLSVEHAVDNLLTVLRAHRDDVLEALDGQVVEGWRASSQQFAEQWLTSLHEVYDECAESRNCLPVWVFREASE